MAGEPRWLFWAKELQAIAQTGLAYARDKYDIERYEAVRRLAAEIMAAGSDAPLERIVDLFAGQSGYATPKVDVRGVVFTGDAVLLVREASDGKWTVPGGWADINQSPAECVIREVEEEAGVRVRVRKLAAVYDRAKHPHVPLFPFHIYKMFFLCDIVGGTPTPGLETTDVGFFPLDALPDLSPGRILPAQIRRMAEHHRDPTLPADFD